MDLTLQLSLIFLGGTLAVAGAIAGIVLVVLGSSRQKTGWVLGGVACGLFGFGTMIAGIVWAMRMDAALGG